MFDMMPFERRNRNASLYNPFREFEDMERAFWGQGSLASFKTDIQNLGDHFLLEADLPGFNKEDIHADLDGDCLTVCAERHSENEEKDKQGNYVRCERSYGSFSRSFDVTGIQADAITAKYENGVLSLNLPKKAENVPTSRRLEIQ